ncbi:MAG: DNRLRE domain-containing protein [Bacteroidetes bacterium]|nr:DNRLRE domain-containing protein [Bacteroidota bacterium]
MIKFLRFSSLSLLAAVLFASCNQDPTSVGSKLIPGQDQVNFKQYDTYQLNTPQKTSFYPFDLKLGTASKVILGKNNYAESDLLYRFDIYLADSLLNYIKSNQLSVTSAWMTMTPTYKLGSTNLNFDIAAYQVRSTWNVIGFDKDSLKNLNYDNTNVLSSLSVTDTLVKFNLQPNVVQEWLKWKADSTTAPKNYGLLLKPTASCQRILGFDAYIPNVTNAIPFLHFILKKAPSFVDTVSVSPFMDVHVLTGSVPTNTTDMVLEGSLAIRSSLFFDLTSLPKNIVVNKATLELQRDSINTTDGTPSTDSLFVYMLADSTTKKMTRDSSVTTLLTRSGNLYSGDISWIIQKWLSGTDNQGIMIELNNEYFSPARIALYGSADPNKLLRPKLKITYLQRQ